MAPQRIVSLIPSATEIVAALGCLDRLVGRSHECDHPEAVKALPVLTRRRVRLEGDSAAIDRRVKAALAEALSVYEVFEDRLGELAPELIVTQSQCEVCAVSLAEVTSAVSRMARHEVPVIDLAPAKLADVYEDIRRVGRALEATAAAVAVVGDMEGRARAIAAKAVGLGTRPRLACVEWIEPPMAAGNWIPEMVALAGGVDPFGRPGAGSHWISWDDIVGQDPDAILFMPCGFDLARTREEATTLQGKPGWSGLKAVRAGRVYAADGSAYFNRPGPRLSESLEILAEILHPEAFRFGHRGSGWMPLLAGCGG